MLRIVIILAVVAALAIVIARMMSRGPAMPAAGSMAPGFTLPSQNGTPVSLSDNRGKWVVLYFYPKDQTPG
jgi:thioredoxin-dependent peroxiredoxin